MLSLAELQRQFVRGLNSQNTAIFDLIRATDTLSAQQVFAIYKSSINGALQGTLKEIYPVCNKLVGDDFFIAMINEYIVQYKSYSPDLGGYGKDLAFFITNFEPAKSLPYLADIARLEWAWHAIFSAAPCQGINYTELAECYVTKGEQIIFSLPTASTLITSPYPIHLIWQANQEDRDNEQVIVLPDNRKFYYLVWRERLTMRIDPIIETEWQILSWIQAKMNLGGICQQLAVKFPRIKLESLLLKWVQVGWLATFEIGTSPCH
jgi:hypothetical protein